ncbi:MAG: hypothetical protein PHR20_01405 [Bacteroidales bacterium]|nr:hypothetical protein [Bacteroidales bacterium]
MSKKRKKPYKTVAFKLSPRQYRSLLNYCRFRRSTPIKVVKKAIVKYIECYSDEPSYESYITENQIDLFEDMPQ